MSEAPALAFEGTCIGCPAAMLIAAGESQAAEATRLAMSEKACDTILTGYCKAALVYIEANEGRREVKLTNEE